MAEPIREAGFNGSLVSLGGSVGAENKGRTVVRHTIALSAGVGQIGCPSNPLRIAATVQQFNHTGQLQVYFGDSTDGPVFFLEPHELLQIDINLPWIGAIYLFGSNAGSVIVNEVSIQQ